MSARISDWERLGKNALRRANGSNAITPAGYATLATRSSGVRLFHPDYLQEGSSVSSNGNNQSDAQHPRPLRRS